MAEECPPFTPRSFPAAPPRECDIVMKGGVTSGVIYPHLVCELAQTYRLHSIGGASAGAIAAAAAAAAELGRTTSRGTAFMGLAAFPDLLTAPQHDGRSLLFHLFRPQPSMRPLFELLTDAMDGWSVLDKPAPPSQVARLVIRLVVRVARRSRRRAVAGLLPGLAVTALGLAGLFVDGTGFGTVLSVMLILLGVLVGFVGLLVAVLSAVLRHIRELPAADFGITSGRGADDADLALTSWLYARTQELAGRPLDEPVTFADLAEHDIDFQVMTTNLSRAQPIAMPWSERTYFFEPAEFRALFGDEVVQVMIDNPPSPPTDARDQRRWEALLSAAGNMKPFPGPAGLPIVVATRMSLSFPLLISAVRLYAVDWTTEHNRAWAKAVDASSQHATGEQGRPVPAPDFRVNWFSDGGLTANLPVQFFDRPLPTRPTFAIDLASFGAERSPSDDEAQNSYLPTRNQGGLHRRTASWDLGKPMSALVTFALSLVQTARTWVDEATLVMPGYRDRVVTIYQSGQEGGLNLSMPADVVNRLSCRGRLAARKLVDRFGPAGDGWRNHRWLRFRAATGALQDWMDGFEQGYTGADPNYDDLFANQPSYRITGADRLRTARARTNSLLDLIREWQAEPSTFTDGRPKQPPALRLVPRTDAQS